MSETHPRSRKKKGLHSWKYKDFRRKKFYDSFGSTNKGERRHKILIIHLYEKG